MKRLAALASAGLAAALFISAPPAEAREVTCEKGTRLKAENGDNKSTITFTNRTPDKQVVYWIDYDGKRHKYQELDPGESYDQPTFLTHPWLVTGARNKCVGYYLAEGKKTSVEPGIAPIIKPKGAKKKKVAEVPKVEERVTVRKPASTFRTPSSEIRDDDFESDDEDKRVARRTEDRKPRLDDAPLSDSDYEDDDTYRGNDNAAGERRENDDLANDDRYASNSHDDEALDDDAVIAEPLPRATQRRRTISPEWGDEPLTNRREGISRNWRCTEYSTRTEQAICNNRQLSRLDDELEQLYSSLVRALPRFQRTKLRRFQQDWLEDREACGRRVNCIKRRTQRRLARLNRRMERVISRRRGNLGGTSTYCEDGRLKSDGRCVRRSREHVGAGGRLPSRGQSLGGRVRDVPGLDGRRIASLSEGTPVTILESTGERHRGYEWFKIRFGNRTGYTWGGILCTNRRVSGVYQVCR